MPHRPYIVSGPPGSGKSVFSMQFLLEGVQGGERCLFVALEEPPNELKANMRVFKWPVDDIEVLDANSDIRRFEPTPVIEISTEVEPIKPIGDLTHCTSSRRARSSLTPRVCRVTTHTEQPDRCPPGSVVLAMICE